MAIVRVVVAVAAWLAMAGVAPAQVPKRVALVIGNAGYANATALINPANDATDMATVLGDLGFEVVLGVDLDRAAFDQKLREFAQRLEGADTGLLFYAGHGLQVGGVNYLVPIDATLARERDLDFEAIRLDFVLRQMEIERDGKTSIVLLDACRDNPLARNLARAMGTRSASIGAGLAQVQGGVGTFIAYSTQPGNVALDGSGRNSPFTAALKTRVLTPARNLTGVMIDVRKDVLVATGGRQVPWDHSALTGDFYFHLASAPQGLPKAGPGGQGAEDLGERLRRLEDALKRKSAASDAATAATLVQLKQRHRQLEDDTRRDRDRMFEVQRGQGRETDAAKRMGATQEIGRLQLQMVRRNKDLAELKAEIEKVEGEVGSRR